MRKDQRPPPGGRPERFAPRNWSLRTKLSIVLLVPAVLAVVLGGLRIIDQVSQAGELDRVSRFIAAQGDVSQLVALLQQERLRATEYVTAGRPADVGPLEEAGTATDDAGAAVRPAVEDLYVDDAGLVGAHRQADQALARLPGLRTLVTTSNAPPSAVISRYSDLIGQIVQLDNALLRGVNTTESSGLANALTGLTLARNEASLQESLMNAVARSAEPAAPDLVELQSSQARLQQGLDEFRGALDAGQRVKYGALIAGPTNGDRTTLLNGVLAGALRPGPGGFDERSSAAIYDAFLGELDQADDGVRNELTGTAAAARQSAVTLAGINGIVLFLALVLGAVVVGLIARQMIRSLRTLRRGAMEVADARLPDAVARMRQGSVPDTDIVPVPVTTREEIGQVARAFDAVHAQAVRLAAEQATLQSNVNAMFVNLSRRSQTLVDRQLKLIEELEAGEEDPDQLSNLFRLDHLATRMRRNSENLLVLAGTDLAQRAVRPVPAIEVLQAAVSEVEQYRRIVVQSPPDLAIIGRVSNDLQHLLAELLENAANFSPPDSRVVMSTSRTADGAFLVEIADEGVGMTPGELAQLNDQLRKSSDATVEASRRMGLFVVGRLAARHGIDVGLFAGSAAAGDRVTAGRPGSGLTARVWIPRHLIAERPGAAQNAGPGHGQGRGQGNSQGGGQGSGLPQRLGSARDDAPSGAFQWGGNGSGDGAGSVGRRSGQLPTPVSGPPSMNPSTPPSMPQSVPQTPAGGGLPTRIPRPVSAEAPPVRPGPDPVVEPSFADSPFAEPEHRPRPTPAQRRPSPLESVPPGESPQARPRPGVEPSGQPIGRPDAPARPEAPSAPVQAAPAVQAADQAPVGVDAPMADAQVLFAPATPAVPLPDPFAAERPRDPFAQSDEPTPIFTEVASGWFRVQHAATERAVAEAVASGGGRSPWERASRERAERQRVGADRGAAGGGSGARAEGAGTSPGRPGPWQAPPPRNAPGGPGRGWPEPVGEDGAEETGQGREQEVDMAPGGPARRWPTPAPPAQRDGSPGSPDFESSTQVLPAQRRSGARPPAPLEPEPVGDRDRQDEHAAERPPTERAGDGQQVGEFATAADTGWRAAEAVRGQSAPTDVTAAGLPRRTPLARLVPGSAAAGDTTGVPAPRRDAEAVRGRLASYQRGVRSGRENRDRPADTELDAGPPAE